MHVVIQSAGWPAAGSDSASSARHSIRTTTQSRALLVEAGDVDDRVEPPADAVTHAEAAVLVGQLVEPVPQHRGHLVVRVAVQWLGVDGQPLAGLGHQDVVVVQVRVHDDAGAGAVVSEVACQRGRLLDHPSGQRRTARQRRQVVGPPRRGDCERAQLVEGGDVQPAVELADDRAGLDVPGPPQADVAQRLEQHRPAVRVGPEQGNSAAAVPVAQREVLVLGLLLGEGHLEHRASADPRDHRHDERAVAVHHPAVGPQLPLVEEAAHQRRQPVHPRGPVGTTGRHPDDPVRQAHQGPAHSRTVTSCPSRPGSWSTGLR